MMTQRTEIIMTNSHVVWPFVGSLIRTLCISTYLIITNIFRGKLPWYFHITNDKISGLTEAKRLSELSCGYTATKLWNCHWNLFRPLSEGRWLTLMIHYISWSNIEIPKKFNTHRVADSKIENKEKNHWYYTG